MASPPLAVRTKANKLILCHEVRFSERVDGHGMGDALDLVLVAPGNRTITVAVRDVDAVISNHLSSSPRQPQPPPNDYLTLLSGDVPTAAEAETMGEQMARALSILEKW